MSMHIDSARIHSTPDREHAPTTVHLHWDHCQVPPGTPTVIHEGSLRLFFLVAILEHHRHHGEQPEADAESKNDGEVASEAVHFVRKGI